MSTPTLNQHEARALGVLIEKELTTPDQYPLSLNALVSGCNQKSNRDPVTDFTPAELVVTMQGLTAKHLAGRSGSGGRVERFVHNARQRLELSVEETAVLAELLLRGPQQPGELRSRVKRMAPVETQEELVAVLQRLATKGLVRNQGRSPGERVERWGQQLCPSAGPAPSTPGSSMAAPSSMPATSHQPAAAPPPSPSAADTPALEDRVRALEDRVAKLEAVLADLGG